MRLEPEAMTSLKKRSRQGEEVFEVAPGRFFFATPESAALANRINSKELSLPDTLVDTFLKKRSCPFSWKTLRKDWIQDLREDTYAINIFNSMDKTLIRNLDSHSDMKRLTHELIMAPLIEVIFGDLDETTKLKILNFQKSNIETLSDKKTSTNSLKFKVSSFLKNFRMTMVLRKEIKRRSRRISVPHHGLIDVVCRYLPSLKMERAVDAVSTLLTATAGPPGAAATGLLYELVRHPDLCQRVEREMARVDPRSLIGGNYDDVPFAHAFLKESLRLWTVPFVFRNVRSDMAVCGQSLNEKESFAASPYFIHTDPKYWSDPEVFDPNRWMNGNSINKDAYVPYGWAPRLCVGAALGERQLLLMLWLFTNRYSLEDVRTSEEIEFSAFQQPVSFTAIIKKRDQTE